MAVMMMDYGTIWVVHLGKRWWAGESDGGGLFDLFLFLPP